jgi:hypothetical protein
MMFFKWQVTFIHGLGIVKPQITWTYEHGFICFEATPFKIFLKHLIFQITCISNKHIQPSIMTTTSYLTQSPPPYPFIINNIETIKDMDL